MELIYNVREGGIEIMEIMENNMMRMIGDLPKKVSEIKDKDSLIEYFMYYYEISIFSVTDEYPYEIIYNNILKKYNQICQEYEVDTDNFSRGWWILVLMLIQESSAINSLNYCLETVESLYEDFNNLSEKEIISYIEILNYALTMSIGEGLEIKPSSILEVNLTVNDDYFLLEEFLNNQEELESIFKKRVRVKDINMVGFSEVFRTPYYKKYASNWTALFDLFVMFFSASTYDIHQNMNLYKEDIDKLYKQIDTILEMFMHTFTILDEDRRKKLKKDLFKKIKAFISKKYEI